MSTSFARLSHRLGVTAKSVIDASAGRLAAWLLKAIRLGRREPISNALARTMRAIGPWLPEHRTGRANLMAAFPEKSPTEIESILAGVWDNLGRVAAEFAFLDRLHVLNVEIEKTSSAADIVYDHATYERFLRLRGDGK